MQNPTKPTYDTALSVNPVLSELQDLYRYRSLILNFTLRNITARYKRSILGIVWTLLDPVLTMLVLTLVFSTFFQKTLPAFPVFLLSGLVVWNFLSQSSNEAVSDLLHAENLIGRLYVPKSIFAIAAIGAGLVNMLLSLIPLLALMLVFRRPVTVSLILLPAWVAIIAIGTLGLSYLVSALAVFYRDVQSLYNVFLRLLFYASGIIYSVESLPGRLRGLIRLNPAYELVELVRRPIYYGMFPTLATILYSIVFAGLILTLGFLVFARHKNEYALRI